jgi:hypothetical protein
MTAYTPDLALVAFAPIGPHHSDASLRAQEAIGEIERYIVRCGLEPSGKVVVWDARGGWVCSRHKTLALAQKRAKALNASYTEGL